MAAMFVFAEMIKTKEIIDDLRYLCRRKRIPVVFLEHQYDGVINAVLNYASGFEKVVKHVLDDHGCKTVKFMGGFPDNPFSLERENIYKHLMKMHGLKVGKDDIMYGDFWDATAARVVNENLDAGMPLPGASTVSFTDFCILLRSLRPFPITAVFVIMSSISSRAEYRGRTARR